MDDFEAGKERFLELVKGADPAVEVVVPTTPSNGMFLISLTKAGNRKFITVNEDDMIDLPNEADVAASVSKMVRDAVTGL